MKRYTMAVVLGLWAVGARAAEVRLPAGAVVELQLTGREQIKPAFDQSALGQILHEPQMRVFLERPKEWFTQEWQEEIAGAKTTAAGTLLRRLLAKPGRVGVYPGDKPGIVWAAALGADAEDIQKQVTALRAERNVPDEHTQIIDNVFLFASSAELLKTAAAALNKPEPAPAAPQLVGTAIGWLRADVPALREMLRTKTDQAAAAARFDKFLTALGFDVVRELELAWSFDGPAVRMESRVLTKGEPTGLLKALTDLPPVDEASLKLLPRNAASGGVSRINLLGVWDAVLAAIQAGSDQADWEKFELRRGELDAKLGFKLREDLVAAVGDTLAYYAEAAPSPIMPGMAALVVTLQDGAKVGACLDRLVAYANDQSPTGRPMPLRIDSRDVDGRKVYSLTGIPFYAPSWTVAGDRLVVANSAQGLDTALAQLAKPQGSILENEDFRKARAALPAQAVAVTYEDTKQLIVGVYGLAQMIGPLMAMQGGPALPFDPNLLPPLATIQEKLFGTVGVFTTDKEHLTFRNYGPFGMNVGVSAGGGGMMLGMILPALTRARGKAHEANCAAHLRQIGLGCHMYADEHNGKFPERLEVLRDDYLKDAQTLHCPAAAGRADSVSYGYLKGVAKTDDGKILAFDAEGNHPGGRHVLYCDGQVNWLTEAQFQEAIRRQSPAKKE